MARKKSPKSKFRPGQCVSFVQLHMERELPFVGKIHEIEQILGDIVLHVEVCHSDGTLWALVREERATLCDEAEYVKLVERRNKTNAARKVTRRCA